MSQINVRVQLLRDRVEDYEFTAADAPTKKKTFPWHFAIAFIVAASGVHGLVGTVWHPSPVLGRIILGLVAAAAYVWLGASIFQYRLSEHSMSTNLRHLCLLGLSGLTVIFGVHEVFEFAGNSLIPQTQHHVPHGDGPDGEPTTGLTDGHHFDRHSLPSLIVQAGIFTVLMVGGTFWLLKTRERLPHWHLDEKTKDGAIRIKHLILPLTTPNYVPSISDQGKLSFVDQNLSVPMTGKLANDIAALDTFATHDDSAKTKCNWQQVLRAVEPHVNSLEAIWLLGSNGGMDDNPRPARRYDSHETTLDGSVAYLGHAALLLLPYLRPSAKIYTCRNSTNGKPLRFQDYEPLSSLMAEILSSSDLKSLQRDVMIDATGGPKMISIVGAAATFRRLSLFQYVDTEPPFDVRIYDVRVEREPELGL